MAFPEGKIAKRALRNCPRVLFRLFQMVKEPAAGEFSIQQIITLGWRCNRWREGVAQCGVGSVSRRHHGQQC